MSEYFGGSSESDDSDSESSPSQERSAARSPDLASGKPIGEVLFGRDKAEAAGDHQTFFERSAAGAEKPSLLAAIAERAAAERNAELDDDDDDSDEEESKAKSKSATAEAVVDDHEAEAEVPLEKLSDDEKKLVVEDFSEERSEELQAERQGVEQNSPEDAALAGAELYHDKLNEKLEDPVASVEAAVAEASEETIAEIEAASEPIEAEATPTAAAPEAALPPEAQEVPEEAAAATPPTPPIPPAPPLGGSSSGGFSGFGGNAAPLRPNAAPTATGPTPEDLYDAERRGQTRGLVVGGILGYLLGRRRGRIKTEKRLLPIQEKLEKEVKGLHDTVADNEASIRRLAAEKARAVDATKREAIVERLRPQPRPPETAPFAEILPTFVRPAGLERAPQAEPAATLRPEQIEQLNHNELLEAGSKILIDGTSLRTIYEAKQITEQGLRHILLESLRGGDIKRALNEELLIKQLSYERDPRVRDQLSADTGGAQAATTSTTTPVGDQISSVEGRQAIESSLEQSPGYNRNHEQSDIPNEVQHSARRTEQLIVGTWLVLVVVLAILAAVLFMKRH